MSNYSAGKVLPDGRQIVQRSGGKAGSRLFVFNPADGRMNSFTWEGYEAQLAQAALELEARRQAVYNRG